MLLRDIGSQKQRWPSSRPRSVLSKKKNLDLESRRLREGRRRRRSSAKRKLRRRRLEAGSVRNHDPPCPRFPPHPEVLAAREPQRAGGVFAGDRHPEGPRIGGGFPFHPHPSLRSKSSFLWTRDSCFSSPYRGISPLVMAFMVSQRRLWLLDCSQELCISTKKIRVSNCL